MIEIKHLKKAYDGVTPLTDVNAVINDGDVISVIGPSGTGKSTLLRCIDLLERPTAGQIFVDGEEITAKGCDVGRLRMKMGMVFQSFNLFPHLTVIENIMLAPVKLLKTDKQTACDEGMSLLRTVGLADKALSYPGELSGGQKQRVAIARALAMKPTTVLFDEPTSALDPTMVGEVLAVIRSLRDKGLTMMIVTHEMSFARDVSTRVFYMDEGVIYEQGTPSEIFTSPVKEKTRAFINRLRVFRREITSRDFDFIAVTNDITNFCGAQLVPARTALHIQRCFEELFMQTLLPLLPEKLDAELLIEYSGASGDCELHLTYGAELNPLTIADEITLKLIKASSREANYSFDGGKSRLDIKI